MNAFQFTNDRRNNLHVCCVCLFKMIKVDTKTRTCKTWNEPNVYPSEPIFVPSPHSKVEIHVLKYTRKVIKSQKDVPNFKTHVMNHSKFNF